MLGKNSLKVKAIIDGASRKNGVRLIKYANVGNHLHMMIKLPGRGLTSRLQYAKWIRALTGHIAHAVAGTDTSASLWKSLDLKNTPRPKNAPGFRASAPLQKLRFWDSRPFTRVVHGRNGFRTMDRYVFKNELEAEGWPKDIAMKMAQEYFESAQFSQSG